MLLAGCASGAGGVELGSSKQAVLICADGATVEGIDVSHWQATIDWDAVAGDGIDFAFIRVSHGVGISDTEFDRNWAEARRVGVIRGAYQFFSAGDDPVAQADLLVDAVGGSLEPGDLPPVLDVEGMSVEGLPAATVVANMRTWLARVRERLGVTPIVYSAKYFWRDVLGDPDFTEDPLWVAHYGVSCPDAPSPWTAWAFWQYSSTGRVAGISGNCDRDVFNGSIADLMAFTGAMPACGDGWCNGGETPDTCTEDCPVCRTVPSLGRDVDESEICFQRGGNPTYWNEETAGFSSSLLWTHTTDAAAADNHGIWQLDFDEAGLYRVEAYTAAGYGQSTQASYELRHEGASEALVVDQSAVDGWTLIGELRFGAGADQWIRLDDNTGEPFSSSTRIVFDAIRLTRLDPPLTPDAGAPLPDDGGVPPSVDAGGDAGMTSPMSEGCGCRAAGSRAPGAPFGVLLGLGLWLRRRRRSRCRGRAQRSAEALPAIIRQTDH